MVKSRIKEFKSIMSLLTVSEKYVDHSVHLMDSEIGNTMYFNKEAFEAGYPSSITIDPVLNIVTCFWIDNFNGTEDEINNRLLGGGGHRLNGPCTLTIMRDVKTVSVEFGIKEREYNLDDYVRIKETDFDYETLIKMFEKMVNRGYKIENQGKVILSRD